MLLVILGSSHAEVPLVRAARALGCTSLLLSGDATGKAISEADRFELCDYSSIEAVKESIVRNGATAVVAGCNDFAAITASKISKLLNFSGHDEPEITELIHTKDRFRNLCKSIGLLVPTAKAFDDAASAKKYVDTQRTIQICKPVDLTGGKGVAVIHDKSQADKIIGRAMGASRIGRIVLEDFIQGDLHSMCALLKERKVVFQFFADEVSQPNPFLVSAAITPASVPANSRINMVNQLEKIAQETELVDGIFHLQFIESERGPVIIDVCRRPPGDLYLRLIEDATNFNISREIISAVIGKGIKPPNRDSLIPTLRQCLMVPKNGTYSSFQTTSTYLELAVETVMLREMPTSVQNYMVEKLGIGIFQSTDLELLRHFMLDFGQHFLPQLKE